MTAGHTSSARPAHDMRTALPGANRRQVLFAMGSGLIAAGLPAGFARAQSTKTLRYALSAFPPSLSPWENTGAAAGAVKLACMRGLMGLDQEGKLVTELAESYDLSDDVTYVFKLRDAKWSNGKPVTAADVVFSLNSITAEGSTAYLKSDLSVIDHVEAIDDKTVKIVLTSPQATFLNYLATYNCAMVSAESTPDNWITCGPFTISSQERGVFIEMKRSADFYDEVALEGIRFIVYADENLRFAALQSGDVDLIEFLPWQQFDTVQSSDSMKLLSTDGPYMFLLFNVEKKGPFADARVRQAVGYAIERQDVIDAAFAGRGSLLTGFPNPSASPFKLDDPSVQYSYNIDKAKKLLAEAGYPNGFDCTLLSTSTYGMHQDTASVVQAYLGMVGINATLSLPDWGTRVQQGKEGNYDIAVQGSSGFFNDPDSLYSVLHSGAPNMFRSFGFKSEKIDTLLEKGRGTLDTSERQKIYTELAKAYFEEAPQVPLNWRTQAYASTDKVKGFTCFPGFTVAHSTYSLDDTTID